MQGNDNFDDEFLTESLLYRDFLFNNFSYMGDINESLNDEIAMYEINKLSSKLENNKAIGLDNVLIEILKHKNDHNVLLSLFNKCFVSGTIASVWRKSILKPILKGPMLDPYTPLNDRHIYV